VYKTVTKQVVQPVVVVPISFPLSKEEAQDPVMQKSLTDGMADSLGVDKDKVSISCIGDECGTSRRRLADDIAITFKVEAGEDTDTTKLAATIDEAATSGHIVANVQEQAASNGVLTPSMKAMPRALPKPVTKAETVTKTVTVVEVVTAAPTGAPTGAPTSAPTNLPTPAATPAATPAGDDVSAASGPHASVMLTVVCMLLVPAWMLA
jgi:hypothetical protein